MGIGIRSHWFVFVAATVGSLGMGAAPFAAAHTMGQSGWNNGGHAAHRQNLLDILLHNGTITQQQYDRLKRKQANRHGHAGAAQELLDVLLNNGSITQSQYNRLEAKRHRRHEMMAHRRRSHHAHAAKKSTPAIKLTGRIQFDAMTASNDRQMIGDGQEFRRAWFGLKGKIAPNWSVRFIYAFKSGGIEEASGSYTGFHDWKITMGNTVVPFSLEFETSSNNIIFQERSMLNSAFNPGRLLGAKAGFDHAVGKRETTFTAGVFGDSVDSNRSNDAQGTGVGGAARGTFAWDHTDTTLMHVGAAVRYRVLGSDQTTGQWKVHPAAHLAPSMLATGVVHNEHKLLAYELEAATAFNSFSAQGQYMDERITGAGMLDVGPGGAITNVVGHRLNLNGWYVQAGYFLTGESRASAYDGGSFGGIKPHGPEGAWQIALRFGSVNFNDGAFRGGREQNLDAALNWYTNANVRFSLNYIKVLKLDTLNSYNGIKPNVIAARFWWHF